MKNLTVLLLSILIAFMGFSQENSSLSEAENELENLLTSLRNAENNSEKKERNIAFKTKLEAVLKMEGAIRYPFSRLKTVGFIDSPDKMLRVINWNIEQDDHTQKYCCFILQVNERKKEVTLHELTKGNEVMALRPTDVLQANQWYGALYYQIIPFEKGNRQMYALLGWDGLGPTSNMKLIDVLYFSGNQAKLGSPVFRVGSQTFKRLFYEHSEKATMSLRYDRKYDRILFDHLSPESPNLEGHYSYYVPDLSYDAFILKNGRWYLKEDVIAVNAKTEEKIEIAVLDKDGNMEIDSLGQPIHKQKVKNKWINPSNPDAPAGGNNHESALPEEGDQGENREATKPKKKKRNKEGNRKKRGWFKKKDKRDPSTLYPYNDMKKPKKKRKKRNQ